MLTIMKKVKIIHQNVRGLLGKKKLFDKLLIKYNPDVFCINEVKTKKKLKFPNYHEYRTDRTTKDGGGVMMLIKKGLQYEEVKVGKHGQGNEYLTYNIMLADNTKLLVAAVYCPPDKQLSRSLFKSIVRANKNCVIVGDLNAHLKVNGSKEDCAKGKQLKDILLANRLVQKNESMVTYIEAKSGNEDTLDYVLASNVIHRRIGRPMAADNIGSDHIPIQFDVNMEPIRIKKHFEPKYKYRSANWEGFERDVIKSFNDLANISESSTEEEIDAYAKKLSECIIQAADDNIPKTKEQPGRGGSTPYPSDIIEMISKKNKLRKEFQTSRSAGVKNQLNNLQKKIKKRTNEVKNEMTRKEAEKLAECSPNSSQFWKEFKRMEKDALGEDNEVSPFRIDEKNPAEKLAVTDAEKCEKFADHLEKIFQTQDDARFDRNHKQVVDDAVDDLKQKFKEMEPNFNGALVKQVTNKDIKIALKKCKKGKACGEDGIQSEMLTHLPRRCFDKIKRLFNVVLKTGHYPEEWKNGIITMLLKSKKPSHLAKSYRPICLTSQLGKVLERIITERLSRYAERFKHIHRKHAGYRKGMSTTDHLVRLVSAIESGFYSNRGNPLMTAALFNDLEKAFDSIWHKGLLYKLKKIGLSLQDLKLLSSYLEGRTFKVKVNGTLSTSRQIKAGVPQGGILSPILFLIYTSDIPDHLLIRNDVEESRFADDVVSWASDRSRILLNFKLQIAAYVYETWSNKWRMKLNPDKCSIVVFHNKEDDPPGLDVKINGVSVKNKSSEKFLGLTFDSKLTWDEHMKAVTQSFNHRMRLLRELRWNNAISNTLTVRLYKTMVRSKFEYGMPAWLHLSLRHRRRLQVMQNDVLRLANKATRKSRLRIVTMHEDAKLPLIKERFTEVAKRYMERKKEDPLLLPVKRRCNDRILTKIGWHRIMCKMKD